MKRILLTGSNGQLGYSCKKDLSEKFDLICTSLVKSKGTLQLDISDRVAVLNTLEKIQPHIVINLSAFTDVDGCEKTRILQIKLILRELKISVIILTAILFIFLLIMFLMVKMDPMMNLAQQIQFLYMELQN